MTERYLGKNKLGTTKRGIGPAYADKALRVGLRVQDLLDPKIFREKLDLVLREKNGVLAKVYNRLPIDAKELAEQYLAMVPRLAPMIDDTVHLVHEALDAQQWVLFEGAQATFLDLDHGTYPFVTSSNPVAGGVCTGAGVGPARDRARRRPREGVPDAGRQRSVPDRAVRGRRGGRPARRPRRRVRHEHRPAAAHRLARPRDAQARGAARTRAPSSRSRSSTCSRRSKELKVCVAYVGDDGKRYDHVPYHQSVLHKVRPVYETLPGWGVEIERASRLEDLPTAARDYVQFVEEFTGVHVSIVGVGPARDQTIVLPRAA